MNLRSCPVLGLLLALTGCSTPIVVSRYSISGEHVTALRTMKGAQINVGKFDAKPTDAPSLTCRAGGTIQTPDREGFSQYVRKAFISELKMAEVYSATAPVTLSGMLDHVDFSSMSGAAWQIGLTISSSNGESVHVEEEYAFSSSFIGWTACNNGAQAFMPGIQDLITKLIHDPGFKPLIGMPDEAPPKSAAADAGPAGVVQMIPPSAKSTDGRRK